MAVIPLPLGDDRGATIRMRIPEQSTLRSRNRRRSLLVLPRGRPLTERVNADGGAGPVDEDAGGDLGQSEGGWSAMSASSHASVSAPGGCAG